VRSDWNINYYYLECNLTVGIGIFPRINAKIMNLPISICMFHIVDCNSVMQFVESVQMS
jgi:hypothetical protein